MHGDKWLAEIPLNINNLRTSKQLAYESTVDADALVEAPKLYGMKHFLFTWNAIAAFTKVRSKNLSATLLWEKSCKAALFHESMQQNIINFKMAPYLEEVR